VEQAEQLLNGILASNPSDLSALVARGTARALARKLKEAVVDFSKAIEIEPRCVQYYTLCCRISRFTARYHVFNTPCRWTKGAVCVMLVAADAAVSSTRDAT
jgi:hypothetical protein